MTDLELTSSRGPLLVSFAVRPEEIELALATEGDSLRHRVLLAIIAELITADPVDVVWPTKPSATVRLAHF
jgi:hypothetical protein